MKSGSAGPFRSTFVCFWKHRKEPREMIFILDVPLPCFLKSSDDVFVCRCHEMHFECGCLRWRPDAGERGGSAGRSGFLPL